MERTPVALVTGPPLVDSSNKQLESVMKRRTPRASSIWVGLLTGALLFLPVSSASGQTWTFKGKVAEGEQIDAVRGPGNRIHLVSSRYYQLNQQGKVLVDEAVGDGQQSSMHFPPAIAVGDDGSVHLVTRHGGSMTDGFDIRYRRRNAGGRWDRDYPVGSRVKRNYVVGAARAGASSVYLITSQAGSNVWGDLHLWQAGPTSASKLGSFGGIWRSDCDARIRASGSRLFLATGKSDPGGTGTFVLHGKAGPQLVSQLRSSKKEHKGRGRTAFPDIYVDRKGAVHLTYGAAQAVLYNRYSSAGKRLLAKDKEIFKGLGEWHISAGLSAVAASDDGQTVVAVSLRSDGSQQARDSDLLWTISKDGGASFSAAADLKRNTDGGEGRRRPRLVAIGNTFYLLFTDRSVRGISLAMLSLPVDRDGDGYPESKDCNDRDKNVHPGAKERCNGYDDNCNKVVDEGCPRDAVPGDPAPGDVAPRDDTVVDPTDTVAADRGRPASDAREEPGAPDGDHPREQRNGDLNVSGSGETGCACRGEGFDPVGTAPIFGVLLLLALLLRRRPAGDAGPSARSTGEKG